MLLTARKLGQLWLHGKALGVWTALHSDVGRALASSAKAVPLCIEQLVGWAEHRVTPPLQTCRVGKLRLIGRPPNISVFHATWGRRA